MKTRTLYADYHLAPDAPRVVQESISLTYDENAIRSIEPGATAAKESRKLLLPPLSNAHDHGRGLRTLAYGVPDQAMEAWVAATYLLPPVDPYLVAVTAFARMAKAGIGSVVHCHLSRAPGALVEEARAVRRAADDVGIRVAFVVPIRNKYRLGYGEDDAILSYMDPEDADYVRSRLKPIPSIDEQFEAVDQIVAECESDLFSIQLGPVSMEYCTRELLERIAATSARDNRRVHMHLLESRYQRERADALFPEGVMKYLDGVGLLSPRLTIAHGTWLKPDECELLAQRGVIVSVNTSSNLRLRSGITPVPHIDKAGLRFALGLDALALDDDDDILREMRLARLLHAGRGFDKGVDDSAMLRATCHNGVMAAGGTPGSISEGQPADLLVLDLADVTSDLTPGLTDIYSILHSRATGRHVHTLIIGGRTIVADGEVVGVDIRTAERELTAQLEEHEAQLKAELGRFDKYRNAIEQFLRAGGHMEGSGCCR